MGFLLSFLLKVSGSVIDVREPLSLTIEKERLRIHLVGDLDERDSC